MYLCAKFISMKKTFIFLLFSLILGILPNAILAQTRVYYFQIDEEIAKPALRKTTMAVEYAQEHNFDYIFMEINTFGGELDAADKIRTMLLDSPIPTIAFINNNAASAGALISIACDSIYMAEGASIGAASVVNQAGEIMPDKYQSYMRSLMRATAEKNGRNPLIAEAMVDPDTYVENISEKGKVLTLTSQEAVKNNFCEGIADSREAALKLAGINNYTIEEQQLSWIEKLILFLVNPAVSGLLIMIIAGGIYMEFQSPGIGIPIIVAVVAGLLYFAPHYLQGLAEHWEILIFILGLALLMIEIFAIPGFGFFGISGIILMVASLVLSMVFNIGFDFHFTPKGSLLSNFLIVLTSLIVGFFLSLWLSKKLFTTTTRYGSLALNTTLDDKEGFVSSDALELQKLVGEQAITRTFMRPAGKIEINGELFDAVSEVGVIEKDTPVVITRYENAQFVVSCQ